MVEAVELYARQIEDARLAAGRGDRAAAVGTLSAVIDASRDEPGLYWQHAAALNELSRLYIRQSDFARAEPLLSRLLQLTMVKGDRHPDVATALAGLAVAKRGLGKHVAAEELYRQALDIREEVLAPNHMATVVTLEQLAETCAARGDFAEALAHLQRALPRREGALSADHATVKALRVRIADLEQRALASIAPRTAALVASQAGAVELESVSRAQPSRRRTVRHASVGAAVMLLAVTGFAFASRTTDEGERALGQPDANATNADFVSSSTASAKSPIGASGISAADAASRARSASTPNAIEPASANDAPALPRAAMLVPKLGKLVVPKITTPSFDSLMRASTKLAREAGSELVGAGVSVRALASNDEASVTPPVLIGPAPAPHFPDELRAQPIDGEVVVQFRVNEKGRVDASSMQVLQSAHELFTAAVRNVLPKFRFEPARSGTPGSKPQAAWVQFRTQFAARQ